ncbi:Retrovirus-related Pol polyprotein from transposon TNT 1-94 [Symbiodinium microadriaticum]|uniref:Retrovirus-related Pol polyprotein from transposon TNT 1-94 n=1 Tax=Symbiodinium microadriaticum TaxID=2951 RepID=A0A1Q9DBU0_SYMMI|nr:Retrovirus-related Pol polyprotein from transposon TNT 1-94 [Symbiodinium microadriaticum]
MDPPDPSVLARGLLTLTDKFINESADASFRTSMLRTSLRLDANKSCPTRSIYKLSWKLWLQAQWLQIYADTSRSLLDAVMGQRDCTAGKPRSKESSVAGGKDQRSPKDGDATATGSAKATMSTMTPTSTATVSSGDTIRGTPWTLEALIQAAQQVVQPQPAEHSGESSPEKTSAGIRTLRLRDIRVCRANASTTALVDSGATHSLRTARSEEEWLDATEVAVQLAGNHKLMMRITEAGTLLMPYKPLGTGPGDTDAATTQTIVPMGQLIQTLGYTMVWSKDSCYMESPEGERVQLQMESGCPQLCELEALSLIARLEDRRLEELNNATVTTKDKLQVSALAMDRSWDYYLMDYVQTGSFESGLRAARDAPFFADLPGECLSGLVPIESLWSGWDIMKELGCFTRSQRRKIHQAKRWVVHLFAGKEGHWKVMKLDQGDVTVLELDVARSPGLDILRSEVWRMLLWGAKEGKIDVVMGGPPSRSQQTGRGGERDVTSMRLVARMMWLHAVAQLGREVNGTPRSKAREVGFILEYPEGVTAEERTRREDLIAAREAEVCDPEYRAEVASWYHTRWLREHVQRPRLELYTGAPTMDASNCFWDTRLWKGYEREKSLRKVSFDQGAMGGLSRNPTTIGTNVNNLLALDEIRIPEGSHLPETHPQDYVWSQGLVEAMVVALSFWDYLKLYSGREPPDKHGEEEEPGITQDAEDGFEDLFADKPVEAKEADAEEVEVHRIPEALDKDLAELPSDVEEYEPSLPEEEAVSKEEEEAEPDAGAIDQDVVLYLEDHGFPIYRFHADKGEFYNHHFRSWLRERGILGTWSEPGVPQTNAQAETTVRWIKDRTRTLLRSAMLPAKLWPAAASAAAAQQRAKVLGWKSLLAAPFGATVHIRKKAFDKSGPLRREQAMESKWIQGKYAWLSTILHHGHLVYVPPNGDEKEKFFHTMHARANLVEPGGPDLELRAEIPKPRRRLKEKSSIENVEMRAAILEEEDIMKLATVTAEQVLSSWDVEQAQLLVTRLAMGHFFENRKFGVFRHGGAVGWMKGIDEFPHLVKVLAKLVLDSYPDAAFTSMLVSYNNKKQLHKDVNNDPRTYNYVAPVQVPERGGEVWIELRYGDCVQGVVEQRNHGDRAIYGHKLPLVQGEGLRFSPRSAHEVCDWEGDRIVLIAYSPQCLGKLNQADVEKLHDFGFPVPLSQLPEFYENEEGETIPIKVQQMSMNIQTEDVQQRSEWEMYLDLNSGLAKVADALASEGTAPAMCKTEVVYTHIEQVLEGLTGPLDVTHTVNPAEVFPRMELWKPAIEKELKSIEVAIERLLQGSEGRKRWLKLPGVQRLPTKFVFTVKPNDKTDITIPTTWYKRKARLVVCGNMAAEDGASVYTEAAPAEAVRAGLTLSVERGWAVVVLDVVAAFLRTPMGRSKNDPVIIVQPPRLLEALGLVEKLELWGLVRALYGLRQSPALWGDYRDHVLRTTAPPPGLRLRQGSAATSWWKVISDTGEISAIILVYVDDFLICGPTEVVKQIANWVRQIWETSDPTHLTPGTSIRFLGMELHVDEDYPNEIGVGQQGYIQELLRLHAVPAQVLDKVPVTKEMVAEREIATEVEPHDIHMAQQLTGEILWLAQRSRPDLSYTTAMMASLCLRSPRQAIEIGMKTLGYVQRTSNFKFQLRVKATSSSLMMFCDAAFAPQGGKSHSGWVVTYAGTPIMWRSGRQQMVTLSTAEAELLAMIDGGIAMKGIEALLGDMNVSVEEKVIASDSTAALSITGGYRGKCKETSEIAEVTSGYNGGYRARNAEATAAGTYSRQKAPVEVERRLEQEEPTELIYQYDTKPKSTHNTKKFPGYVFRE